MITKRGLFVLIVAIISYAAVIIVQIPAFLQVAGVLLALLAVGFAYTWTVGLGLRCHLQCERQAVVGTPVSVRLIFTNRLPLPRGGLKIRLTFPPAGSAGTYLWTWLHALGPLGDRHVLLRPSCRIRGRFMVGQTTLFVADPLGLWCREKTFREERPLEVLPATVSLNSFPFIESGAGFRDPEKTMPTPGFSNEFYAIREYQSGDSPRWIHWLSTARMRQLMTRQYETPVQRRVLMILDCTRSGLPVIGDSEPFELAVAAIASVVRFAADTDHEVGLLTLGQHPLLIKPAAGIDNVREMISALAAVEQDGRRGRYNVSAILTSGVQSLIIVSSNPSRAFCKMAQTLRDEGLNLSLVITGEPGPDQAPDPRRGIARLSRLNMPICHAKTFESLKYDLEHPVAAPEQMTPQRWIQRRPTATLRT